MLHFSFHQFRENCAHYALARCAYAFALCTVVHVAHEKKKISSADFLQRKKNLIMLIALWMLSGSLFFAQFSGILHAISKVKRIAFAPKIWVKCHSELYTRVLIQYSWRMLCICVCGAIFFNRIMLMLHTCTVIYVNNSILCPFGCFQYLVHAQQLYNAERWQTKSQAYDLHRIWQLAKAKHWTILSGFCALEIEESEKKRTIIGMKWMPASIETPMKNVQFVSFLCAL